MKDKPFTVLIDDAVIPDSTKTLILKTGEHHLGVISEDFRTESRTFIIERAQTFDLSITLRDTTPVLLFEAPENTKVYLDDTPISTLGETMATEPGPHTVRFQVGDYSVVKQLTIEKGKPTGLLLPLM